jgi:hypothetical protein
MVAISSPTGSTWARMKESDLAALEFVSRVPLGTCNAIHYPKERHKSLNFRFGKARSKLNGPPNQFWPEAEARQTLAYIGHAAPLIDIQINLGSWRCYMRQFNGTRGNNVSADRAA